MEKRGVCGDCMDERKKECDKNATVWLCQRRQARDEARGK